MVSLSRMSVVTACVAALVGGGGVFATMEHARAVEAAESAAVVSRVAAEVKSARGDAALFAHVRHLSLSADRDALAARVDELLAGHAVTVAEAERVLASSAGRVVDDMSRDALREAVGDAPGWGVAAVSDATGRVRALTGDVEGDVTEWEAAREAERKAAAEEARERAAAVEASQRVPAERVTVPQVPTRSDPSPSPSSSGVTLSFSVNLSGMQSVLDSCSGPVLLSEQWFPHIAEHASCGGSKFLTLGVGDRVRISGLVNGTYQVAWIETHPWWSNSYTVPKAGTIIMQTSVPDQQARLIYAHKVG